MALYSLKSSRHLNYHLNSIPFRANALRQVARSRCSDGVAKWSPVAPWVPCRALQARRARAPHLGALWRRRVQGQWQHVQLPPPWPARMERRWRKGCQRRPGRGPWARASRQRVVRNAREHRHGRLLSAALGRRPQACVGRISRLRGDNRVWRRLVSGGWTVLAAG